MLNFALRRPVAVFIAAISTALLAVLAFIRMPVDIFPNLNLPVIIVAQPYGGMDPGQMEGFLVYYYEYHFLYITGIDHVESKSIQNIGLVKLYFHPDTDMSQALAQTISYVDRARAFMPPGTVAPFVVRFDAGTVPIGQLVFSSDVRSVAEIQDLALNRVRPMFATLPGVSAPPPFGASQRTIVVRVDPDRLRSYNMSPDEVTRAVAAGNTILPGGNVRVGDLNRIVQLNTPVRQIKDLESLPLRVGSGPTVFLRDVGVIEDSSDVATGYALVNGRRTVYIPVTKRADASTLDVISRVKANLPRMQAAIPDDIHIGFEFDQSTYVKNSLRGLAVEGVLGAFLTALVVWLFLRDLRSAFIVVVTIPFALFAALVALWLTGQTVNIMTLGGLALSIGILVDEATVAIENIHTHLTRGEPVGRGILNACREVLTPRLLAMLAVVAVFVPSLFMTGVARSLFVPLSLAVGFAMLASFVLSNTLLPAMAVYLLERHHGTGDGRFIDRLQARHGRLLERLSPLRWAIVLAYAGLTIGGVWLIGRRMPTDLFPSANAGQFQVRLRAPTGTRLERTEVIVLKALDVIKAEAGADNVETTLAFVGNPTSNYPINSIYLWSSGPHEALILVALRSGSGIRIDALKERLRQKLPAALPGVVASFEAGDIVSQIMNFGAPTPIEVTVSGPNFANDRAFAQKLRDEMAKIPSLRDLQFEQPLDYPTIDVNIDRVRAGQLGVTVEQLGRALAAATSSSRYVTPDYWRDPNSGIAYQVQVEIPQARVASIDDLASLPAAPTGASRPLIGDVAQLSSGSAPGEYDRYNQQRMVTISANIAGVDLGRAAVSVRDAVARLGKPPAGVTVDVRGQVAPMDETLAGLRTGLLLAILVVLLLLAANFQSVRLSLVVLATVPAVVLGVALALLLTGTTLNVQSYMGAIMSIGVSVANAILLITFAEKARIAGETAEVAGISAARTRLRPILMTSVAMMAGMIPMALALGEGGEQTAPLGRAVIGGLAASTLSVLFVLPFVFAVAQQRAHRRSASRHPDDVNAVEA
jgi:multidrug efflux pump subunit AcrB